MPAIRFELRLVVSRGMWSRNDVDVDPSVCLAAMGNLGGIPGAKFLPAGEGDSRQALQQRRFPRALIPHGYELWQRYIGANVLLAELIDLLEPARARQKGGGLVTGLRRHCSGVNYVEREIFEWTKEGLKEDGTRAKKKRDFASGVSIESPIVQYSLQRQRRGGAVGGPPACMSQMDSANCGEGPACTNFYSTRVRTEPVPSIWPASTASA